MDLDVHMKSESPRVELVAPGSPLAERAVDLILAVQAELDLPPRKVWPPVRLAEHTRERQRTSLGIWVARDGEMIVGHGLIRTVARDHQEFSQLADPLIKLALANGYLVELGGLTVASSYRQAGVGKALLEARLAWLAARPEPVVAVAAIWRTSPGSLRLAQHYGVRIGAGKLGAYDLYRYSHY